MLELAGRIRTKALWYLNRNGQSQRTLAKAPFLTLHDVRRELGTNPWTEASSEAQEP